MNPKQYSPEKTKIESGEASSHDEAEKLVEQGGAQLSVGSLRQAAEKLKAKIEAAKLQREKNVEQKISERELLIGEERQNDELLVTARETLEYFTSMQELDQLDKADTKKLEELQVIVSSLENQRVEIEKKVATISSRLEIFEKLYDAAKKEDIERTVKSLIEKSHTELDPQIDQLAATIKDLVSRDNSLYRSMEQQQQATYGAWKKIGEAFSRAKNMLSEKSNYGSILEQILKNSRSPEELSQKLTEARKSLGMFKGKEKAAIDFILAQGQVFNEYNHAAEQFSFLQQQRESLKSERSNLSEQFKVILGKSWEAEDKISELCGASFGMGLPANLWHRLEHHITKFADLQHLEGNRKVGKHEGWYNATQNPEGRALYDTWKNITETAGGYGLTIMNPNKTERENQ